MRSWPRSCSLRPRSARASRSSAGPPCWPRRLPGLAARARRAQPASRRGARRPRGGLERLPIAAGVSQLVLEQLASASQFCPLPHGVDVVVEGAPAHAFYAIVDGAVVVNRDGEEVAHLGPGDYFGERGLLDNAPRNATVTTVEASTLLRLDGEVLLERSRPRRRCDPRSTARTCPAGLRLRLRQRHWLTIPPGAEREYGPGSLTPRGRRRDGLRPVPRAGRGAERRRRGPSRG